MDGASKGMECGGVLRGGLDMGDVRSHCPQWTLRYWGCLSVEAGFMTSMHLSHRIPTRNIARHRLILVSLKGTIIPDSKH